MRWLQDESSHFFTEVSVKNKHVTLRVKKLTMWGVRQNQQLASGKTRKWQNAWQSERHKSCGRLEKHLLGDWIINRRLHASNAETLSYTSQKHPGKVSRAVVQSCMMKEISTAVIIMKKTTAPDREYNSSVRLLWWSHSYGFQIFFLINLTLTFRVV